MSRLTSAILFGLLLLGCGGGPAVAPPPNPAWPATTLSIQEADCESCLDRAAKKLLEVPGTTKATIVLTKAELNLSYDPALTSPEALAALVAKAIGLKTVVGAGKGSYLAGGEFPPSADVRFVSKRGEAFELKEALAPGKYTFVDYYADWCSPCRKLDAVFAQLLAERPDVALRKANIVDWDSEVAKRALIGIEALPYVEVYGPDGVRLATISGFKPDALREALAPPPPNRVTP